MPSARASCNVRKWCRESGDARAGLEAPRRPHRHIRDRIKSGVREDLLGVCQKCGGQIKVLRGKTGKRFVACVGKEGEEPTPAVGAAPTARLRTDVPAAAEGHYHGHRQELPANAGGRRSKSSGAAAADSRGCSASTSIVPAKRSTGRAPRRERLTAGASGRARGGRLDRRNGVLVTIEGSDGCGKSTQACCYVSALGARPARGLRSAPGAVMREPGGTPVGERIRDLLLHEPGRPRPGPRRCSMRPHAPSRQVLLPELTRAVVLSRPLRRLVARLPGLRPRPRVDGCSRSTGLGYRGLLPDLTFRRPGRPRVGRARAGAPGPHRARGSAPAAGGRGLRSLSPALSRALPRRGRAAPARSSPPRWSGGARGRGRRASAWRLRTPCSNGFPRAARQDLFARGSARPALDAWISAGPEALAKRCSCSSWLAPRRPRCGGCAQCAPTAERRRAAAPTRTCPWSPARAT